MGDAQRELAGREWLAGTNIAFRTSVLRQIGGFRTDLGRTGGGPNLLSNEETDALRRAVAAGHRAFYSPAAVVEHRIGADRLTKEWFRRRVAWQCVSDFILDPEVARQRAGRARKAASRRGTFANPNPAPFGAS